MQIYLVLARFVHFAALMVLFGLSAFPLYSGKAALRLLAPRTLLPWFIAATGVTLLSAFLWWDAATTTMSGSWKGALDREILQTVLFQTEFGHVWFARLIFCLGLLIALLYWGHVITMRSIPMVVAVSAGLLTASLAGVGHAVMLTGVAGGVLVTAQIFHVLSAGAWMGGLIALVLTVLNVREIRDETALDDLVFALRRFSSMGTVAVGAVVVSGFLTALLILGDASSLLSTDYGRLLLVKLSFVLLMIAVAAHNRWHLSVRIAEKGVEAREATTSLLRNLSLEIGLGVCVIAVVSLLGTVPPRGV